MSWVASIHTYVFIILKNELIVLGSCSLMGKEIENKGITTRGRVKVDSGKEGIWMFAFNGQSIKHKSQEVMLHLCRN